MIIVHYIRCIVNTSLLMYGKLFLEVKKQVKSHVERIKELREDSDLLQKDVAAVLGTTQQVYSRYEKGENEIPIRHIITLARFYKVSTDYILGLTDKK